MRTFIAVLLCAWLLAPASFAQVTGNPPATPAKVDQPPPPKLQLPNDVVEDLRDIARALKKPTAPPNLQHPDDVVEDLRDIAAALNPPKPQASADPFWNGVEHWSWLIGFFFVAAAAFYEGVRDSVKAIRRETDAEEARSAQRLIEADDSTGPGKLAAIRAKYPIDPKEKTRVRNWWWLFGSIVVFGLGASAALGLLILAVAPEQTVLLKTYYFQHAKASAWEILDSNFASAFAATWIALLFYGASQMHRLREANENLRIATNEAESIQKFQADREKEKTAAARRDNAEARAIAFGLEFKPPWQDDAKTPDPDDEKFEQVAREAVRRSVGTPPDDDADQKTIRKETDRLWDLLVRPMWGFRWIPPDFKTFMRRFRQGDTFSKSDNDWTSFATAIESGQITVIRDRTQNIAAKMKSAPAKTV